MLEGVAQFGVAEGFPDGKHRCGGGDLSVLGVVVGEEFCQRFFGVVGDVLPGLLGVEPLSCERGARDGVQSLSVREFAGVAVVVGLVVVGFAVEFVEFFEGGCRRSCGRIVFATSGC